jgi:hypothetical protein
LSSTRTDEEAARLAAELATQEDLDRPSIAPLVEPSHQGRNNSQATLENLSWATGFLVTVALSTDLPAQVIKSPTVRMADFDDENTRRRLGRKQLSEA